MTQTTILALGTSAATSTDVTLAAGESATLSIFNATPGEFSLQLARFSVSLVSPGAPVIVGYLDSENRVAQVFGPGVYQVSRPLLGQAFGVAVDV